MNCPFGDCGETLKIIDMRQHMGAHLLHERLSENSHILAMSLALGSSSPNQALAEDRKSSVFVISKLGSLVFLTSSF